MAAFERVLSEVAVYGKLNFQKLQLPPGFGSCQDLADRALGEPQYVVAKHTLANVMLEQLLLHLEGDLCCVQLVLIPCGRAATFRLVAGQAGINAACPYGPLIR
ncbi:hypothetical protein INR49_016709 [Caranx melampygus]|nr:hypothetical protein INR49_016709 [Caranx melampygus]